MQCPSHRPILNWITQLYIVDVPLSHCNKNSPGIDFFYLFYAASIARFLQIKMVIAYATLHDHNS